ncbi:uncharacterized protein [Epargyreus clarus]|uniref:uncharacterized protein isoform X2 n=1 Tax=Epargyreus clarus TaxID=520877 RepID=UPI003C2F12B7
MAIVVFVLMILWCTASAEEKHHPKFPRSDDRDLFKKEVCSSHNDDLRNEVMQKSKCGEPKEVFVDLKLQVSYLQVTPSAVWVKRCVGLCDGVDSKCVATKSKIENVPVRIYNVKTDKERCSTFPVKVHESCGCCSMSSDDCAAPRVYNPPEPEYDVESI